MSHLLLHSATSDGNTLTYITLRAIFGLHERFIFMATHTSVSSHLFDSFSEPLFPQLYKKLLNSEREELTCPAVPKLKNEEERNDSTGARAKNSIAVPI